MICALRGAERRGITVAAAIAALVAVIAGTSRAEAGVADPIVIETVVTQWPVEGGGIRYGRTCRARPSIRHTIPIAVADQPLAQAAVRASSTLTFLAE